VLGTTGNSSVDWIEVEENGFMTQYDDQATIKWKIMENNEWQLETTPPMQEPLVSKLGYLENTEAAKQILNGTYVWYQLTNSTVLIFPSGG
jgi:hypothetical protein